MIKNVFDKKDVDELIGRINKLTSNSKQLWGKMSVSQMLAHCNVTYEMVYENVHPKPNPLVKLMLKFFVKNSVVNDVPYNRNLKTAPQFIISAEKNFEQEKSRLINYIKKTFELGAGHFENKESNSFGRLNTTEWNNMFYKHLDHHLNQFGV